MGCVVSESGGAKLELVGRERRKILHEDLCNGVDANGTGPNQIVDLVLGGNLVCTCELRSATDRVRVLAAQELTNVDMLERNVEDPRSLQEVFKRRY